MVERPIIYVVLLCILCLSLSTEALTKALYLKSVGSSKPLFLL